MAAASGPPTATCVTILTRLQPALVVPFVRRLKTLRLQLGTHVFSFSPLVFWFCPLSRPASRPNAPFSFPFPSYSYTEIRNCKINDAESHQPAKSAILARVDIDIRKIHGTGIEEIRPQWICPYWCGWRAKV